MTDKNAPESTGRIMKMTKRQAAFSYDSLFHFWDHIDDISVKTAFVEEMTDLLSRHAVSGNHRAYAPYTPDDVFHPRVRLEAKKCSPTTCGQHYEALPSYTRLAWQLTYASALICNPQSDNAYRNYFVPHTDKMFLDQEQAVSFVRNRPKEFVIEEKKSGFNWRNPFRKISGQERLAENIQGNIEDHMKDDPFIEAIYMNGSGHYLENLESSLHRLAVHEAPCLEVYWEETKRSVFKPANVQQPSSTSLVLVPAKS